jgi:hypothetical protein
MLKAMKLIGLAGWIALTCLGQNSGSPAPAATEKPPKHFYQARFGVQEVENERVINSRSYSMILSSGGYERSSIRAGQKVPFSTTSGTTTQWQQVDVGVYIDCSALEERGEEVVLKVSANISSIMEVPSDSRPPPSTPIIRDNRWESTVMLPLKQPTIIFVSDDPASKRKMQLQLTVTPIR